MTRPDRHFAYCPKEFLYGIKQQFTERELALRELGQNSQDADATDIRVDYYYSAQQMTLTFLDNGCGMDLTVILNHYLRFFDSSKEGEKKQGGAMVPGPNQHAVLRPGTGGYLYANRHGSGILPGPSTKTFPGSFLNWIVKRYKRLSRGLTAPLFEWLWAWHPRKFLLTP